ncbi:CXADR-like membrane protein [Heterodontus francisci]|uniref:CXADR-like membrane protein n=1 Tax=Heterodontus francisci TaxID=7792 RepID=UPI00355B009B
MKENPHKEFTVFNHTHTRSPGSYYTDLATVNEDNRYELIGNLTQGNASIRMKDLQLNDSSDYFCHVHVKNGGGENVTQDGIKLQVVAPATILELSAVNDNISGDTIMCRVEGEPPANITWIDPENNTLTEDSNSATVTRVPDKHQTVGEFLNPTLRGTYSCVAVNEHGRDVCQIHFSADEKDKLNIVLYIWPAILIIFFLLICFTIWWLKRDQQEAGSNSVAHDTVSQQAETDPPGAESNPVYSVVNFTKLQQAETDPQESEHVSLHGNVNILRPHQAETDVIYATVIKATTQCE